MNGVKPWAAVKVGPGLNQKNGLKGSGGFNSGMEAREKWMPPTVDELRTKTNPKVTYDGVVLGGSAGPGRYSRGIQGKIEKNRPDTYFVNSPERWFTTGTAAGEANTSRSTQPDRAVNRPATTREYFGNTATENNAPYIPGNYQASTRPMCTKPLAKGPAHGINNGPRGDAYTYGKDSFQNRMNARTLTESSNRFGAVSTYAKAIVAPVLDILRPSRKENAVGTIRPTGNPHSTVSKPSMFNPADKPKTTNKETTLDNPNFGGMPLASGADGYLSNIYNQSEKMTPQQRDNTNCPHIAPAGSALHAKARLYNPEYNMSLNADKQLLSQSRAPNGNMNIYNPYTNIKIDKMDSDRSTNRTLFSNNSRIVAGPTMDQMGRVNQKLPLGVGQMCARNQPALLNAFESNPYTQSLQSVA